MTDQEPIEAETNTQLPALIKKAHAQLTEYLKSGAHILCPLDVTAPPPGFIPRVVAIHISSNPDDKEVYVMEPARAASGSFQARPARLEFTKIANMKICDALGISWDDERSRRIDDGKDPMEIVYKAVGYRIDYQGGRQQLEGICCINLDAIRDEMVNIKTVQAQDAMAKQGTQEWGKVNWKWKKAIEENKVAELIEKEVRAEMLKKRLKRFELAETGAKLRAIRSKGFRTTYTAKELEKDFVDIRMIPVGGSPDVINKAGAAFQNLFGQPKQEAEPQRAEETIIDAKANKAEPEPAVDSKESILADFACCDQSQAIELTVDIAERKAFPVDPYRLKEMSETALKGLVSMLLDLPDAKGGAK